MRKIIFILLILFLASPLGAATYYVRTDGHDTNCDGTQNEAEGDGTCAWLTIDYAADNVSASDVIRVQAGTYEERVSPGVNGTSGNTVTFVADGAVTTCGFDFSSSSYIRVIGFTMDSDEGSCSEQNGVVNINGTSSYLEIWNNTIRDGNYNAIRMGLTDTCNQCIVFGNTMYNFGIGNGSGMIVNTIGDNNLIAYNEGYNSHPDGFSISGDSNRWIGNYIHGFSEASGGHTDGFQAGTSTDGMENNLIEATFFVGMGGAGDEHVTQFSNVGSGGAMTENILRRNVWHNISNATLGINQTSGGAIDYTRYYHNTTAEAQENSSVTRGVVVYGSNTDDTYIWNNIEYEPWGNSVSSNLDVFYVTGTLTCDYNLAYDPDGSVSFTSPWTNQSNAQSNADPDFNNYGSDDFTLGGSSNATGNAGPLTTTSGSGTGTTFNVVTDGGGFFRGDNTNLTQYGGNLVVGDTIMVGTDEVVISSISGDAITVTASFTWADSEDVYFGDDITPDIGAYPYKPGGYTLSGTYVLSAETVTVTPNEAGLVRMVIVFEDNLPVGVDSTSPFAISGVGGGTLIVRMYPLYASDTLYTNASEDGDDETPPATSGWSPGKSKTGVDIGEDIVFHVTDTGDGVDGTTIEVDVEGTTYCCSDGSCGNKTLGRSGTSADYTITHSHASWPYGEEINVEIDAADLATPPNNMNTDIYSFTTEAEPGGNTVTLTGGPRTLTTTDGSQTLTW